jgi:Zn-finger in ubiquitin-hydrolases and other protein
MKGTAAGVPVEAAVARGQPGVAGWGAMAICDHLEFIQVVEPSSTGCEDCIRAGHHDWVHLRLCMSCGHVGCCDSSPGLHASKHAPASGHPVVQSYEPGEDWFWCYVDDVMFELKGAPPALSHP